MWLFLAFPFLITAGLYASVGFGGGSTYNALLAIAKVDYRLLPAIALTCNVIVVTGGVFRFWRQGILEVKPALPFLITSVPAAWTGGRLSVSETVFIGLLGLALLLSGIRLALNNTLQAAHLNNDIPVLTPYVAGGLIGFLSGLVGVGGGIFLAPVLYFLRWNTPRKIAAMCSLFILANSLSGLTGQLMKLNDLSLIKEAVEFWPLALAVLLGGQIGSWAASQHFQPVFIKRLTSVLILYVAARLLIRWIGLMGWI